jgi:hypothetical protein
VNTRSNAIHKISSEPNYYSPETCVRIIGFRRCAVSSATKEADVHGFDLTGNQRFAHWLIIAQSHTSYAVRAPPPPPLTHSRTHALTHSRTLALSLSRSHDLSISRPLPALCNVNECSVIYAHNKKRLYYMSYIVSN